MVIRSYFEKGINMTKFLTYASTFNLFLSGLSLGLAFSPYRRLSMILSFVVLIAGIVLLHLTAINIIKSRKGDKLMFYSADVKWQNLGLDVFLIIRKFSELHFYDAQEELEKLVIKAGLWDNLVYYATSEECNGSSGGFKLIHNLELKGD